MKVDASKTPVVNLPAFGKVTYVKMDNTVNTVKIFPSIKGQTINGSPGFYYELFAQTETVTLELSGNNWFIIR